jgi:3-deoxy-7-phosphoheptulonate synthase
MNGTPNQISTKGNELGHIILRGSSQGPNYNAEYVQEAKVSLQSRGLIEAIGIDSSHGNSGKQADMQVKVVLNVGEQVALGESAIVMVMIESNLLSGAQKLEQPDGTYKPLAELTKGQSITDACSGLEQTELMLNILSGSVRTRRGGRDKIEN